MNLPPILYAEDEDNDVFFMRRAFRQAEIAHPLVVVADGEEAIDYCSGQGGYADRTIHPLPCLFLMDLNMPRKSGLEVLQWLRSNRSTAALPVIIFTSSIHDADLERAYRSGANAYLAKPSNINELTAMMRAVREFWLVHNQSVDPAVCGRTDQTAVTALR